MLVQNLQVNKKVAILWQINPSLNKIHKLSQYFQRVNHYNSLNLLISNLQIKLWKDQLKIGTKTQEKAYKTVEKSVATTKLAQFLKENK